MNHVDEVLDHCDVCRAYGKAPHAPIAGTSAVSTYNEKAQGGLLLLGDLIALHAAEMFPKYSLLPPVQSKNPQELRDVSCRGWLGTFGPPTCIKMDEGGEWKNDIRTDLRAERRIKLQL